MYEEEEQKDKTDRRYNKAKNRQQETDPDLEWAGHCLVFPEATHHELHWHEHDDHERPKQDEERNVEDFWELSFQAIHTLVHIVLRPEQPIGELGTTATERLIVPFLFTCTGPARKAVLIVAFWASHVIIALLGNIFHSLV